MKKTTQEVLSLAADLVEADGAWTRGAVARDRLGSRVSVFDPNASCFCAAGAIWRAGGSMWVPADAAFRDFLGTPHIGRWNDTVGRTQREVVAALRAAAEAQA